MPYITMCQGPKCTANGAGLIIRDMEDLAFGAGCVEASGCMGQCSKGPNGMYSEKSGAKGKITNKLNKYSKLTEMLGEFIQGFGLDDTQSRIHKVKFAIRREPNADTRMQAIEETLASIDDQQKEMHPELYAEMLCLRSREVTKSDPISAYNDLRDALKLLPDWPWAFVSLAQVLDNLHMPRGALASMQRAIEIGTGVDKNALTRGMVRLERKAADSKGPDVPPEGIEMDIKYVKDKSLGGETVQKPDKKGGKGKKTEKQGQDGNGAGAESGGDSDTVEKPEKAKEKTQKTKGGKEVKASKAKSKVKKDKSPAPKKDKQDKDAEAKPEAAAAKPEAEANNAVQAQSQEAKSPKFEDTKKSAKEEQLVAKSVEVMKEMLGRKDKEKVEKSKSKDLDGTKSKELDKDKKHRHGEKKKKKTKKKKPEKSEHGDYQEWQLRESEWMNHDCKRVTFACKGKPSKHFDSTIWHIDLAANLGDDGEEIQRSYTPYSTADEYKKGILILVIKVYPNGKMSGHVGKMKPGDTILVSNPVATIDPADYPEGGIMVAGGSAVVVALQVITAMLPLISDSFHLYLCNRKQEDVLLMTEFNELMQAYPHFHMTNCLSQDKAPENPEGRAMWSSGRLNAEQLKDAPLNLKVMISGPDPLCKMVALAFLELGKQEDDIACLDVDLEDILHPEDKDEDAGLLRAHTQRLPETVEEKPAVDVPRARIKASKPMVISIDAIAAGAPKVSRPPPAGLGVFSSLFFCGCKSSDALSEGSEEKIIQKA